jgi:pimeloyl-ACP methyl ester carboxylesterase
MATTEVVPGRDLAYESIGEGRPIVLFHGFMTNRTMWLGHGPAAAIAARGYRVILPDLRGHGESPQPHDQASYPPDVLADDGLALVEHLGLEDYDLGGYSLGGRVALRMLARGARPARAVVAAQGLDVVSSPPRSSQYRNVLTAMANGDVVENEDLARWIRLSGSSPLVLLHVLDTHVPTSMDALRQIPTPTLVAVGDQDDTHTSADALAEALPNGQFIRVPGNHFTALGSPEFAEAVVDFLVK